MSAIGNYSYLLFHLNDHSMQHEFKIIPADSSHLLALNDHRTITAGKSRKPAFHSRINAH